MVAERPVFRVVRTAIREQDEALAVARMLPIASHAPCHPSRPVSLGPEFPRLPMTSMLHPDPTATLLPEAAVSFSGEDWSKIRAVRAPNPFSSRTAFTRRASAAPVTYGTKIWARPDCWSAETRSSWPGWNTTPEGCSRERRERTFCLRR